VRQVLIFRVGERLCGLDTIRIREVLEEPACHYIPRTPSWCAGAIDVQGQVLPLVDLPQFLGLGAGQPNRRCIVLDVAPGALALRVTAIHRIFAVEDDAVLLPKEEGAGPLVTAILLLDAGPIELLDARVILEEIQSVMGENA
jgi:purine-binding chemotaxis protein CheW